jgi:hypothetical protein
LPKRFSIEALMSKTEFLLGASAQLPGFLNRSSAGETPVGVEASKSFSRLSNLMLGSRLA